MEKNEIELKTFNPAKKYAEEILFPLLEAYQRFSRKADFGTEDLNESILIPEEIRNIERYNGLKGMCNILSNLLNTISSTIILKKNREEITQLNELIITLEKLKEIFDNNKERFFTQTIKESNQIEVLNREFFNMIRKIIDICYVNTEILMTKNKLLFSDSKDEYLTDEEIKEEIKKEFVEG